jgi:hypothetical protein
MLHMELGAVPLDATAEGKLSELHAIQYLR